MVNVKQTKWMNFKGYIFTNDIIQLVVVPEIGGRVMSYGYTKDNILFVNQELDGKLFNFTSYSPAEFPKIRRERGFQLYGGEKTWVSPQSDWEGPPYMELDHGVYSIEVNPHSNGMIIHLESPVCRETHLQIIRDIIVPDAGSEIEFIQTLYNHGTISVRKGIWQVTMINRPAVIQMFTEGKSKYSGGIHHFDIVDREEPSIKKIGEYTQVNCIDNRKYKVGTDVNIGYVDTYVESNLILRKQLPISNGPYAHGCSIEVFNSPDYPYCEVEVHSPMQDLLPGTSMKNSVKWSLHAV